MAAKKRKGTSKGKRAVRFTASQIAYVHKAIDKALAAHKSSCHCGPSCSCDACQAKYHGK